MASKRKTVQVAARGKKTGSSAPDESHLNPNQVTFCRLYVKHGNATLAYFDAYPGVLASAARQGGYRLLQEQKIRDQVEMLKERDALKLDMSREKILKLLGEIAENPFHKKQHDALLALWEKFGYDQPADDGNGETHDRGVSESVQRILAGRKTG